MSHSGMTNPSGNCTAGYYCKAGSKIPAPEQDSEDGGTETPDLFVCPVHMCIINAHTSLSVQSFLCDIYYPVGFCVAGEYCPEGVSAPLSCDRGFHSTVDRASSCEKCPAGNYCPTIKTQNPTICKEGIIA